MIFVVGWIAAIGEGKGWAIFILVLLVVGAVCAYFFHIRPNKIKEEREKMLRSFALKLHSAQAKRDQSGIRYWTIITKTY